MGWQYEKERRIKEFEKATSHLSEEDKEVLRDSGLGSYTESTNALWKAMDKLTPEKREVYYGDVIKALESNNLKEQEIAIKYWTKWYQGFRDSKEWKAFRKKYLEENPICKKCGAPSCSPHHNPPAIKFFIQHGFTKPLQDYNNFEPLCKECHLEIEGIILD